MEPTQRPKLWTPRQTDDDDAVLATRTSRNTIRRHLQRLFYMGQLFSMPPLCMRSSSSLRFRWLSWRVWHYLLVTTSLMVELLWVITKKLIDDESLLEALFNSRNMTLLFNSVGLVGATVFLRLAAKFQALSLAFIRVERRAGGLGYQPSLGVICICLIVAAPLLILFDLAAKVALVSCATRDTDQDLENLFSVDNFLHFRTGYSGFRHQYIVLSGIIYLYAFAQTLWVFNDFLIVFVSLALAGRFQQLTKTLTHAVEKDLDDEYWSWARMRFNDLSRLTKEVDNILGPHIVSSCGFSIVVMCYYVYLAISAQMEGQKASVCVTTASTKAVICLLRMALVSFTAARVMEEGRSLQPVLISVPSDRACEEMYNLLQQVITDDIALTGMKFFSMSRSFFLKMMGTVVSFLLLMFQSE